MKNTLAITAAIAAFSFTSGAMASTTFTTTTAGVYDYASVGLTGNIPGIGPYSQSAYAGPIVLQTTYGGKTYDVVTFCFDLFHDINVGFGYQAPETYTYSTASISFDNSTGVGTGNPLSIAQANEISGLAQLGAQLFLTKSGDLADEMPAIQAAIWHDEYGLTTTFSDAGQLADYDGYLGMTFNSAAGPAVLAENAQGQVIGDWQGLVVGAIAVPEPATWAMMIVGLFGMGAALRGRQRPIRAT